ncbi:MAG: hypothetical protein B6D64_00440 [Bacteroidetes bacterium 4484_276]|nr:MAG: hypothetical protein B6D64_00440 [Bacteroidetes bacterium 4484_276]OYT13502.1 MAG: CBS domain-containing protein [Bacteroidetes bacterium 4572_114]
MTVNQLISNSIIPLRKTDSAGTALAWMYESRVSHLPVIDGQSYVGLIGDVEILYVEDQNTKLSGFCSNLPRPFIAGGEHYFNALQLMIGQGLSVLPVLDEKEYYLGAITRDKILIEMAGSISVQNPGGIIVLEINQNDYSLSEISRIVESNDTKILSLSLKSVHNSNKLEVTLKLNRVNIEGAIQSLGRFDYEIKAYFGENRKDDDLLLDRYDSLMAYLKV